MVPVKRGLRPTGRGRLFESSGIATLMIGLRRSTTSDLEGSDTIALEHANYDGRGQALMDVGDLAVAAYDEDLRAVERRFDYGNLCVRGVAENVRGGGGDDVRAICQGNQLFVGAVVADADVDVGG